MLKLVPVIVTEVPTGPLIGVKLEMNGRIAAVLINKFNSLSISERTTKSILPSPFISADLIIIGPSEAAGKSCATPKLALASLS